MMREFTLVKKRRHTNQQVSIYAILTPEVHFFPSKTMLHVL